MSETIGQTGPSWPQKGLSSPIYTAPALTPRTTQADGFVHETMGVDRKQAVSTYVWTATVITLLVVWACLEKAITKFVGDEGRAAGLYFLLHSNVIAKN